jgi:hypothetical protein
MLEVRNYEPKFELDQLVKLAKLSFNMGTRSESIWLRTGRPYSPRTSGL